MKQLGLLVRLIIGIIAGMLIGLCGGWFGIADTTGFVAVIRLLATFTSLFSTFLSFMIPLIIIAFITVGMAELGQKANRLFGLTLLLAYGTTTISGFLTFFIGKAFLPSLIKPITGDVLESNAFEPFFTIEVTPIFGVMTALVLAFVLGIGMANLKGDSMLKVFRDLQNIVSGVLRRVIHQGYRNGAKRVFVRDTFGEEGSICGYYRLRRQPETEEGWLEAVYEGEHR